MRYAASDLREQAVIKSLFYSTNADFEEVAVLTTVATVRGSYMPQTGRESMRAEQIDSESRALFVMRYRDWLTTDHVIEIRGVVFEIHSVVDPGGRRRFQELVISERAAPILTA